jgi:hypothetical protein
MGGNKELWKKKNEEEKINKQKVTESQHADALITLLK